VKGYQAEADDFAKISAGPVCEKQPVCHGSIRGALFNNAINL